MEGKHRELLQLHRMRFLREVDVTRLLPFLQAGEVLDSHDVDLIAGESSASAKVGKLLDLLPLKPPPAFQTLCVGLESTYPQLLTEMFVGPAIPSSVHHTASQPVSVMVTKEPLRPVNLPPCDIKDPLALTNQRLVNKLGQQTNLKGDDAVSPVGHQGGSSSNSSSNRYSYTPRPAPPPPLLPPPPPSQSSLGHGSGGGGEYDAGASSNVSALRAELKQVTSERDILREELQKSLQTKLDICVRDMTSDINTKLGGAAAAAPADKLAPIPDIDSLKTQCDWAMTELMTLKHHQSETMKKCEQAVKEAELLRATLKLTKDKNESLQEEIHMLKGKYNEMVADRQRLQTELDDQRKQRDADKLEIGELRKQQRDVMSESGSSEVLNMYDNAVDKYETLRQEYEDVRKRYADTIAQLTSTKSNVELLQDENGRIKLQNDEILKERNHLLKQHGILKQHLTSSIQTTSYEKANSEKELQKTKIERDEYSKKVSILKDERDAVLHEYSLVMSERKTVHREITELDNKLEETKRKLEQSDKDKKAFSDEMEKSRREISKISQDRDRIQKQLAELREKYDEMVEVERGRRDSLVKEFDRKLQSESIPRLERDKERTSSERYKDRSSKDMSLVGLKEMDGLKREVERLQSELTDTQQELEDAKKTRDWVMKEREKIVRERESVKTLCDKMRHERDDAVSSYMEAVKDADELRKQKSDTQREMKELRDKYDALKDQEARKSQLHAIGHNHSRDSAIDTDMHEWETETLHVDIGGLNSNDLGFDLVGGKDDPQFPHDPSIFVANVRPESVVYSKLRANDQVMKINNLDVSKVERKVALQAAKSSGTHISMVIRRRKPASVRAVHTVHLSLNGERDCGLNTEQGLYVSHIVPGSAAAREGTIAVGDRLLNINGQPVDGLSLSDVHQLLLLPGSPLLTLHVLKYCLQHPYHMVNSSSMSSGNVLLTESSPDALSLSPKSPHPTTLWPSSSPESGKTGGGGGGGGAGGLKSSGSQTDSLDSPQPSARTPPHRGGRGRMLPSPPTSQHAPPGHGPPSHYSQNERSRERLLDGPHKQNYDHKTRSMEKTHNSSPQDKDTLFTRAKKAIARPFSSTDRSERDQRSKSSVVETFHYATNEQEVIAGLDEILNEHDKQGKKERKRRSEGKDNEHGGTWPKSRPHDFNTVGHVSKERPPIGVAMLGSENRYSENGRVKGPPTPPERNDSFKRSASIKHSPQSSDASACSVKFNPHFGVPSQPQPVMSQSSPSHSSHAHSRSPAPSPSYMSSPQSKPPPTPTYQQAFKTPAENDKPNISTSSQSSVASSLTGGFSDKHTGFSNAPPTSSKNFSPLNSAPFPQSSTPDYSVVSGPHAHPKYTLPTRSHQRPKPDRPNSAPSRSRKERKEMAALIHGNMERGGSHHPHQNRVPPSSLDLQPVFSPRPLPHSGHQITPTYGGGGGDITSSNKSSLSSFGSLTGPLSPRDKPLHAETTKPPSGPAHSQLLRSAHPPYHLVSSQPHPPSGSSGPGSLTAQAIVSPRYGSPPGYYPPSSSSSVSSSSHHHPHHQHPTSSSSVPDMPPPPLLPPHHHTVAGSGEGIGERGAGFNRFSSPSPSPSQQSSSGPGGHDSLGTSDGDFQRSSVGGPFMAMSHDGSSSFPHRRGGGGGGGGGGGMLDGGRIRIPSNPSMMSSSNASVTAISSSSFEGRLSERSSPISPSFLPPEYHQQHHHLPPGTSRSLPTAHTAARRPHKGETRNINVEKSSEPLGIKIDTSDSGGIFVSSVSENSLARKAGLQIGDQLLEVCGINMRNATYNLAASVLRQCDGSINMLVQYNPNKYQDTEGSSDDDDDDNDDTDESDTDKKDGRRVHGRTPSRTPSHRISNDTITPDTCSPQTLSPNSISPSHSAKADDSNFPLSAREPRFVILKKHGSHDNLGFNLIGGNAVGIFVQNVQQNSIASGPTGLRCGDQILEFNGTNFRSVTAEQAMLEITRPADSVAVLAQYNIGKYNKIQEQPGDALFVRALFDHVAEADGELNFKKNDILFVDYTVYQSQVGVWRAWLVDDQGNKLCCGTVWSKVKLEEDLASRHSNPDLGIEDELKGSRRGSASARRSFFRRKKHQRNNSKDSRELSSISDASINSDSVPFLDADGCIMTYERVERLDSTMCRPVLIIGPLHEPLINKLTSESPDKYCRIEPEILKASMSSLETGQHDGAFVDFKARSDGSFECITVQSVKEIIDKGRHCMLHCSPSAIETLHKVQIYPIVLFIKHKSAKQIREVKDTRFLPEKLSQKMAKELYDTYTDFEAKFKRYFSDIIQGGNLAFMCYKIKGAIDKESKKTLWVPSGTL